MWTSPATKGKGRDKTLENFFGKNFSKPFKKLYLKPLRGFRKASRFFISRELNVLVLTNSREARVCVRGRARVRIVKSKAKPWKTFLKKSFPNLSKNFT
jgi:hypothetical protein